MRPILITGGTGFVGRYVVRALVASGQPLRALVRSSSKIPSDWHRHELVELAVYDESSPRAKLGQVLDGISRVVHLAGLAHTAGPKTQFFRDNAQFTEQLCAEARRVDVTHFIHLSSLAAATPNSVSYRIDDHSDFEPKSAYGRSKKLAELHVQDLLGKAAMAVSLRPPLVIGPDSRGNWGLLQRIAATEVWLPFATVRARRNFVSLETLVRAILQLIDSVQGPDVSGNYIISDSQPAELNQIVTWLRAGMGKPPRLFAFPPALLLAGGKFLGRGSQFSGLLGSLEVDDTLFRTTFGFTYQSDIQQVVEQSGREYLRIGFDG